MSTDRSGAAPRAAAARCVAAVIDGQVLERALEREQPGVADRDRGLLGELSYGTLRLFPRLDALLQAMLRKPLRRRDRNLRALAAVGLYQLSATRIPAHAAVSATVAAAGALRLGPARGLLNALLRRYQREQQALLAALPEAARTAHPAWLVDALRQQWPDRYPQILAAGNAAPPLTLRVNRLRGSRDDYLGELARAGIEARAGNLSADAVTLERGRDVHAIPGFDAGRVSVQDEAAQLAARALGPRRGERILDACAAPGGKTGALLERLDGTGEVLAVDLNAGRLDRVRENLERLTLPAELLPANLCEPPPALRRRAPFDAILLDVPCSASGVIRRHPDIKLLRRAADIPGFAAQQTALLRAAWPLLRPGGRLLYATCSLLREENQDVVSAFLAARGDAGEMPLELPGAQACAPGWQLLPDPDGGDGLYYALLQRERAP